jgi:NitT/TauT family transport system ATP-binding protein
MSGSLTIHPSSRVADLVGLLYVVLNTFGGKTDLYILEKELEVDLDDLMPIVYTAATLGFVTIGEGDIMITDKGIDFVKSGLKRRKDIIRRSLKLAEPFKTASELGRFTPDELLEKLREKGIQLYVSPSGKYDLELTLIEWGVYSGFLTKEDEVYTLNTPEVQT